MALGYITQHTKSTERPNDLSGREHRLDLFVLAQFKEARTRSADEVLQRDDKDLANSIRTGGEVENIMNPLK